MITDDTIKDIKLHLENCKFRELVDKYFHHNFDWTIRGTSELSGNYHDKEAFFRDVIGRLNSFLENGWTMTIRDIYYDPEKSTLIIEMVGNVKRKAGGDYNNEYCWIYKFDSSGKVIKLIAYYDSLLVNQTLTPHLKRNGTCPET